MGQRLCKQNYWIRMCQQGRTVGAQKDQMDIHKYELLLVIHITNRAYASSHGTRDSLSKGPSENTEKHEGKVWAINYTQAWKNRRTRHECTQQSMKQLSSVCVPIEQTTENSVVTTRWADWKASKPSSSSSQKGMWRLHGHSNHLESPANSGAHGHTFWYWHGGRTRHSSLSPGIPSA